MAAAAPPTSSTEIPPPRANPLLLGHGAAEAALLAAWRSGRMPHAWLIGGSYGIGKATLAFRFARFVLAGGETGAGEGGLALDPGHPVFRRVAAGGHSDLFTVERKPKPRKPGDDEDEEERKKLRNEIVVEDVREATGFLHLTPAEGAWRIVIVDGAELMNRNAANALLKSLEEPPRQALLLLVSHAPGRLPPTIRSRCRLLTVQALPTETLAELIGRYRQDLTDADRATLAKIGEGSIGRALELAEAGGLELHRALETLLRRLPRLDLPRVHALADELAREREDDKILTLLELLRSRVRRFVRFNVHFVAASDQLGGEYGSITPESSSGAALDRWLAVWDKIGRLAAALPGVHLDRKQVVIEAFMAIEQAAAGREVAKI